MLTIPDFDLIVDPAAEASLNPREVQALAACRAILARGDCLTHAMLCAELCNSSDWVHAAYHTLGELRLIPQRPRGQPRKAPPVVGADGLTDLERDCLNACRDLAPGASRVTPDDVRRRLRRNANAVRAALRRLAALHLLDANLLPVAAPPPHQGPAPLPEAPPPYHHPHGSQPAPPVRSRRRLGGAGGPCAAEIEDYRRAWRRVRALARPAPAPVPEIEETPP